LKLAPEAKSKVTEQCEILLKVIGDTLTILDSLL